MYLAAVEIKRDVVYGMRDSELLVDLFSMQQ
jgi:hypothetical protein